MSQTAGVKPMAIAGRVAIERERCLGMTPAERAWRKQWLADQILTKEPVEVSEYWTQRINPIRRIYRAPLDITFGALSGVLGASRAADYRYIAGKLGLFAVFVLSAHYYFKYQGNDWTKKGGWRVIKTRKMVLPGQEGFPHLPDRCDHSDYANRNFRNSPI